MKTVTKYGKVVSQVSADFLKSVMMGGSKARVDCAYNLLIDSLLNIQDAEVLSGTYNYISRRCGEEFLDQVVNTVNAKRM